jgi:hypothetical protein
VPVCACANIATSLDECVRDRVRVLERSNRVHASGVQACQWPGSDA